MSACPCWSTDKHSQVWATLRLSDSAYDAVRRWADADAQSMNARIEGVLDTEDVRRRCAAHDRFLDAMLFRILATPER